MTDVDIRSLCGWRGVDAVQQAFASQFPTFSQAAPHLMQAPASTDPILLYKAWRDVLGKDPAYVAQQIGDCLVAGTIVLGEKIKPIEQVQIGDMVWSGEGKLTKVVSTRTLVTAKPLVKIKTKGGLSITCTADHLCLAYRVALISGKRVTRNYYERCIGSGQNRGNVLAAYEAMEPEWVPAGELTGDHYLLAVANYEPISLPDDSILDQIWSDSRGRRMLGYFVGDGCASGGSAEFCVSVLDMSDELLVTLASLGFDPKVDEYPKGTAAWRIRVHNKLLVDWLRSNFYDAAGAKVYPSWAIGDKDFLDGLFEADGCDVRDGERVIDSTSLSVIYGALTTLRGLGINPNVSRSHRSAGTYANAKPLYRVIWSDSRQKNVIWRDENYICHRVKSVELIEGPTTVYDIGVADEHHSFIANGYVVHNCVSFGHSHANDLLQCIEIGLGEPVSFQETDTEFIYATSREVAGILGNQDGSYGSAAIKAMTTIGMVSRSMLGTDGAYSGQRAKDWGLHGAPASVKSEAAPFKLGGGALVSTWDELVAAIQNGYPVTICTGQGFTLVRDSEGFCTARGTWGHCMFIAGVRFDRPGACIIQSWGPDSPTGPTALDQPSFSFWADQAIIEKILGQGDSWALSKSPSFVVRPTPPSWSYTDAA